MTKTDAIEAMQRGEKVTHRYFSADEWITIKDGRIITEDDAQASVPEFFKFRRNDGWETDWSIYKPQNK